MSTQLNMGTPVQFDLFDVAERTSASATSVIWGPPVPLANAPGAQAEHLVCEGELTNQPHPIDGDHVLCVDGEPLEDRIMADLIFERGEDGIWRLPGRVRITIEVLGE